MVDAQDLAHRPVERVGERSVAEVVEKSPRLDGRRLALVECQALGHLPGDPVDPERVLEARVVRAGEHEVGEAGLADPPEPLEGGVPDERERGAAQRDDAVDRVEDRLALLRFRAGDHDPREPRGRKALALPDRRRGMCQRPEVDSEGAQLI